MQEFFKTRKVYFPRVKESWESTRNLYNNSYLNLFKYLKFNISEDIFEILKGGNHLLFKNSKVENFSFFEEKNLSYNLGLYYEEYCYDSPNNFFEMVKKNLKMRISEVFIFINKEEYKRIPVLCCGIIEEEQVFIIINPLNGTLDYVKIEDCTSNFREGQKKLFLLNVPGMHRVKGINIKASTEVSLINYIERFCFFKFNNDHSLIGLQFFEYILKNQINPEDIKGFVKHKEQAIQWLNIASKYAKTLDGKIYCNLCTIKKLYILSSENNSEQMSYLISILRNIELENLK